MLLLSHLSLLDHGKADHPENSGRLQAILQAFQENSHPINLTVTRRATKKELCLVHDPEYVEYVLSLEGQHASLDHETHLTPGSVNAALQAVGLGLELVEQITKGNCQSGFALIRPPGHHAGRSSAMGYCIFNSVAISAAYALSMGLTRILIVDFDVHHGNGTQEIFYEDDRVLFIDLHQENLFPEGSGNVEEMGSGDGFGFTVNIPLAAASQDEDYFKAFRENVLPLAQEFNPELVLVSAGFDAHESDPMGFMRLTSKGFASLSKELRTFAKVAFFLEGGYDSFYLAQNVIACIND